MKITAHQIAGDLYDVRYSYDRTLDRLSMAEIRQIARRDCAEIEIVRHGHRGVGQPLTETVDEFTASAQRLRAQRQALGWE